MGIRTKKTEMSIIGAPLETQKPRSLIKKLRVALNKFSSLRSRKTLLSQVYEKRVAE